MRQGAGEGVAAEEHVGDAAALAAGQPGGDDRVSVREDVVDDHRPAREQDDHSFQSGVLEGAHRLDHPGGEMEVAAVALALRVGGFADDSDTEVGPRRARTVQGVGKVNPRSLGAQGFEDGGAVGDVAAGALPADRPAAALVADVVGAVAGDMNAGGRAGKGQDALFFGEQHQGLAHAGAGDLAMGGAADRTGERPVGVKILKEPHAEFHAQNAADGVVDARLRNLAGIDRGGEMLDEIAVAGRHHGHVDAGVDRLDDLGPFVCARQPRDAVPVRNDKTLEAELTLEHRGEQPGVAVHFIAVPAAVGGHDRGDAGLDCADIGGQKEAAQGRLVAFGVALVDSAAGAAIAEVVLGAGEDAVGPAERVALKAAHLGGAHDLRQFGGLAKALVGAAPALVTDRGDARSESPVDAGPGHLEGDDLRCLAHQRGITRRPEADIVRKDDRPLDVVVAMHGIDAVEDRDGQTGGEGLGLEAVVHVRPAGGRVGLRHSAAAAEHRAEEKTGDISLGGEVGEVGLGHLADLLRQSQAAEEILDAVRHRGVGVEVGLAERRQGNGQESEQYKEKRGGTGSVHGGYSFISQ